jgi:hypothetical protein
MGLWERLIVEVRYPHRNDWTISSVDGANLSNLVNLPLSGGAPPAEIGGIWRRIRNKRRCRCLPCYWEEEGHKKQWGRPWLLQGDLYGEAHCPISATQGFKFGLNSFQPWLLESYRALLGLSARPRASEMRHCTSLNNLTVSGSGAGIAEKRGLLHR